MLFGSLVCPALLGTKSCPTAPGPFQDSQRLRSASGAGIDRNLQLSVHQIPPFKSTRKQDLADLKHQEESKNIGWRPSLLGARTLLGAPGLTTRSKKLLVTRGIATSNKNALRLEAIATRVEAI